MTNQNHLPSWAEIMRELNDKRKDKPPPAPLPPPRYPVKKKKK